MIPPYGGNPNVWAQQVRAAFDRYREKLTWKSAGSNPSQNGTILWDEVNGYPVVSKDDEFVPLLMGSSTGWGTYNDTAGAQSLAASTSATFTVNAGTSITSYEPDDVTAFWDSSTNTITGREGDAIMVKVQSVYTPDDATASDIAFSVDIGGAVGVVEYQDFALIKGAGVAHRLSWTFLAYTLDTWEANGGTIKVESDGPGDLTEKRVLIARVHRA